MSIPSGICARPGLAPTPLRPTDDRATEDDVFYAYRLILKRDPDPAGLAHYQTARRRRPLARPTDSQLRQLRRVPAPADRRSDADAGGSRRISRLHSEARHRFRAGHLPLAQVRGARPAGGAGEPARRRRGRGRRGQRRRAHVSRRLDRRHGRPRDRGGAEPRQPAAAVPRHRLQRLRERRGPARTPRRTAGASSR